MSVISPNSDMHGGEIYADAAGASIMFSCNESTRLFLACASAISPRIAKEFTAQTRCEQCAIYRWLVALDISAMRGRFGGGGNSLGMDGAPAKYAATRKDAFRELFCEVQRVLQQLFIRRVGRNQLL
jgi:hypothetical protein